MWAGPTGAHCSAPAAGGSSERTRARSDSNTWIGASRIGQDSLADLDPVEFRRFLDTVSPDEFAAEPDEEPLPDDDD